jgi:hypothetical protein
LATLAKAFNSCYLWKYVLFQMLPLWMVKLMVASGLERLVSSFFFSKVGTVPHVLWNAPAHEEKFDCSESH